MLVPNLRVLLLVASGVLMAFPGPLRAHVVPNTTVEADFSADGGYVLRINVDPRTFMAADPTTLPPVPASWYRDQTQEQVAATHQKAREYLGASLGLIFSGHKVPLPECLFQAIDGDDNTPLDAETQEVHLLATARGTVPNGASSFQIDFAKGANTSLILLSTQPGKAAPRAQVVFPGEVSPEVILRTETSAPPAPNPAPASEDSMNHIWLILVGGGTLIALIIGWRLLIRYRHHHKFHRKPRSM
ncbi:MAG: hypothetical protein ACO1TE_20015 [Prosthecobacter sp.]